MAKTGSTMSDGHKAKLAEGREDGRAVRRYLEALDSTKVRRGRPFNVDSARAKLAEIKEALSGDCDALERLILTQRHIDLEAAIARADNGSEANVDDLKAAFIKAAAGYSERKGISYAAWRGAGVPADVLREAGVTRG